MNRFRLFAIGTMVMFAMTMVAQQATTSSDAHGGSGGGVPTVGTQLKVLTEKLDLSDEQRAKITPILQELNDATLKIAQDKSLSHEERLAKVRPQRYKAHEQIREMLSDDQKRKLDQYLQGPHSEMHGSLTGTTSPPPPAPRN